MDGSLRSYRLQVRCSVKQGHEFISSLQNNFKEATQGATEVAVVQTWDLQICRKAYLRVHFRVRQLAWRTVYDMVTMAAYMLSALQKDYQSG